MKKILIIRLSALGDTIHTLPLAYALRRHFPQAQIDWIVEDKAAEFIVNNPLLNNVYVLKRKNSGKLKSLFEFIRIIKKIRKEKYDIAADTQQLLKSGLISAYSGAKRKITLDKGREFSFLFSNEVIKTDREPFDINYHVVKRTLLTASYLGCRDIDYEFIIPDFSNEYSNFIKDTINNIDKTKQTIVIAPATTWINKHWSIQGWRDVIDEFKDKCNIIITASGKEKPLTTEIMQGIKHENIIDLTGKTSLADLVYVFKNSALVVSPDSGSCHIAWAVQKPKILTLFFATSSGRTAPIGGKYFSISAECGCSPCMKKHCRLKKNKYKCIETIKSQNVVNIMKKILQLS